MWAFYSDNGTNLLGIWNGMAWVELITLDRNTAIVFWGVGACDRNVVMFEVPTEVALLMPILEYPSCYSEQVHVMSGIRDAIRGLTNPWFISPVRNNKDQLCQEVL